MISYSDPTMLSLLLGLGARVTWPSCAKPKGVESPSTLKENPYNN